MRLVHLASALALALVPAATGAALRVGAAAPDFTTTGALAGKPFRLHLREQLRNGPVVLYFFPKAFTQGCTLEAHAFSEAALEFRRAGARVIGMSASSQDEITRFSVEACRNAFPVAVSSPETTAAYDVAWDAHPGLTTRTSYVIAPNGRIIYEYTDPQWGNHVANTLAAVKAWRARHRR